MAGGKDYGIFIAFVSSNGTFTRCFHQGLGCTRKKMVKKIKEESYMSQSPKLNKYLRGDPMSRTVSSVVTGEDRIASCIRNVTFNLSLNILIHYLQGLIHTYTLYILTHYLQCLWSV